MKHNKEFVPSPKRPKKGKSKKKGKSASGSGLKVEKVEPTIEGKVDFPMMDIDEEQKPKGKRKNGAGFGSEVTNRHNDNTERHEGAETPLKRQRTKDGNGVPVIKQENTAE